LSETLSRQWRIETLFNTYVFNQVVREKYEVSKYYCQADEAPGGGSSASGNTSGASRKTYFVHFVDYLGSNAFRRIQDAIDIANDNDKIVVAPGVYNENIVITK
jgi:pectin methylesterase-like acyl-CoA thioesterase